MQRTIAHNPLFQKTNETNWLPYEEFPLASRFINIEGNRIHYIDEGEGPTLLFVHTPMWLFVWRDLIRALRGNFRCVALDFPMTGLSEASPNYQPNLPNAANVLEQFMNELELTDITLVAHDVGGPVSLGVATQMPERFKAIVLNGSFGWSLTKYNRNVARFLGTISSPLVASINVQTNFIARLTTGSGGIGKHLSTAGKRAFKGGFKERQSRRALTQMFANVLKQDGYLEELERDLKKLEHLPVLLAYGENDQGRKAGFQKQFEAIFPNHTSVIIQGANHFPQMDAPHEVAETISTWLQNK